MCSEQDPLSLFKALQCIFGFSQKETGVRSVAVATTQKVSFSFFCDLRAKFEKHCSNIFRELSLIQCFTVQVKRFTTSSLTAFAKYKTVNISRTKKYILKRKTPFFFNLKSLYFTGTLSLSNIGYLIQTGPCMSLTDKILRQSHLTANNAFTRSNFH